MLQVLTCPKRRPESSLREFLARRTRPEGLPLCSLLHRCLPGLVPVVSSFVVLHFLCHDGNHCDNEIGWSLPPLLRRWRASSVFVAYQAGGKYNRYVRLVIADRVAALG